MNASGEASSLLGNLASVDVNVRIDIESALLLSMVAILPILVWFVCKIHIVMKKEEISDYWFGIAAFVGSDRYCSLSSFVAFVCFVG